MTGIELITAERTRQVEAEGWNATHDDAHTDESLAYAAAVYAWPAPRPITIKNAWPWDRISWKPTIPERLPVRCGCRSVSECVHLGEVTADARRAARVRDLVKAGALIAAEIDRLQRAAPGSEGATHG